MEVGTELRAARAAAGLSQSELARRAGTSQSAVARYESGAATPALRTLERLLEVCGRQLIIAAQPRVHAGGLIAQHRKQLLELAGRHGARNLRIFGSLARGGGGPESDVDLLVELDPGRTLLDLVAFRREASELLGRPVDIATTEMLRHVVRREAERDAVSL